ncbi:Oidioi.mRNA.OKI2018_I69.PAR.g10659.t1.cds [Oikopleura dioica]|uniref:2'-phosphotransferase n=1 Tax=Oikopleura dioica TaxID=34765 RepID=A0ABN7RW46_OIKDI|nr:Oidioi.mRNA.OKI2018_I69.PAR.g10659.t1.cds [Oikopleura dioica]
MTETKPQEPKPVPAQDAAEQQSPQEVDEAQDKFQTVGAKNHRVENIKKNYSKPNIRKRTESWSQKDHQLTRALAGILRHGMMGFQPDESGFLYLDDILKHHHFKDTLKVGEDDLKRVGELEDKKGVKMFELVHDGKLWKMRARATNNPAGVEVSLKMAAEYPVCVHGTWWKAWEDMKKKGISRLGRNPIHFCSGMIGRGGVIPGIRSNCEVLVYIDLQRAIKDKIKFYRDEDGVLSTHGNKHSVISPKYFTHAIHVSPTTGQQIYCEDLSNLKGVEGEAHESVRPQRNQGNQGRGGRGGGRGRGRGRGGGRGGSRAESRASEVKPDGPAGDNTENPTINEDGSAAATKPKNNRPRRNRNRNKNKTDNNKDKPAQDETKKEGTPANSDEVQKVTEKVQKLDVAAEESK